jgi:hypothetical protein
MSPTALERQIATRVARFDWLRIAREVDAEGWSRLGALLSPAECRSLVQAYDEARFRSTVDMAQHRFGRGEYRYFATPLPPLVAALRSAAYAQLAPIANRWMEALGGNAYPPTLAAYLARCHAAGQQRPTPLLLRYGAIPHMWRWGLDFVANCTPARFRAIMEVRRRACNWKA